MISEKALVESCIKGNKKMQEQLYKIYKSKMFSICLRYATNTTDAEDMLQDGFMKAFSALKNFRFEGSFEGWLRRIFVASSVEFIRKAKIRRPLPLHEVPDHDYSISGLEKLQASEIIQLIQSLPDKYRIVFNLFELEGYSHKEISHFLEIPEGTSKSQLARAKRKLREALSQNLN